MGMSSRENFLEMVGEGVGNSSEGFAKKGSKDLSNQAFDPLKLQETGKVGSE